MVNVQGDANGISRRGCTGACNAVNTTLTTDAQLQKQGEWLLGALGLTEKLRSPAAHCLKASPFACWCRPTALAFLKGWEGSLDLLSSSHTHTHLTNTSTGYVQISLILIKGSSLTLNISAEVKYPHSSAHLVLNSK